MKNKSVLLILFLVVAPLLSACNSKTSDQLQFLITYKADGTEAIKYGLFFDKDEITSSNFNLNLEKVGKVKYSTSISNGNYSVKNINATELEVGDLLTIRLDKKAKISKLKSYDFLKDASSIVARNGARSKGWILNSKVHYGDEISYGDFAYSELPLFVSKDSKVIDPNSLQGKETGYGGYYKYGDKDQYKYMFPFVLDGNTRQ